MGNRGVGLIADTLQLHGGGSLIQTKRLNPRKMCAARYRIKIWQVSKIWVVVKMVLLFWDSGLNVVVGVQALACTEANPGLHSRLSTCNYRFNPPPCYFGSKKQVF